MGNRKGNLTRLHVLQGQETAAQRFERRVIREPHPKGCWLWRGSHNPRGYSKMGWIRNGKRGWLYVHRVSYEIHIGQIPEGMQVLHRCDNTGCVNPEHLFHGTNMDNVLDKMKKRRCANQYFRDVGQGPELTYPRFRRNR